MEYDSEISKSAFDFQVPVGGFGSYAIGILPEEEAVLAGAFGVAMQQIKNIQNVDLERFAQVVYSLETNEGLPLTNGTNRPTDNFLVNQALTKIALGSDIYGTYNTSNFFGAMTGLPYPIAQIKAGIERLQTSKLVIIYDQIYLATTWEQASCTASVQTDGTNYFLAGLTNFTGGGYGRGGAPAPTITITDGAGFNPVVELEIGTDPNNLTTYGKISGYNIINYGSQPTIPGPLTITIQAPPTAALPVTAGGSPATGGTNTPSGTAGWPGMNSVIQAYIDQANLEITSIQTSNPNNFETAKLLNTNYNTLGTMLKIEQRARYIARPPVPIPFFDSLAQYPQSLYNFIDSVPGFSQDTNPNGPAQNLETIADQCSPAGQSLIGMMRQERNQARLNLIGLTLDNNIPITIDENLQKQKLSNGTVPDAVEGIQCEGGEIYSLPAYSQTKNCSNQILAPEPAGYYDPDINQVRITESVGPGSVDSILNCEQQTPVVGTLVPNGIGIPVYGVPGAPPGTVPAFGIRNLGLFPVRDVLPPNLDINYISSTILPSGYNVQDAIDKVIECNCTCWIV